MDKKFTVTGVSDSDSGYKVRFANDLVSRIKILSKTGHDTNLIETPVPITKGECVAHLKTTDLYENAKYKEAIDEADAKYNKVATVKASGVKKVKPAPSLDAIKARANAAESVTE
jgi:hypothetical protein